MYTFKDSCNSAMVVFEQDFMLSIIRGFNEEPVLMSKILHNSDLLEEYISNFFELYDKKFGSNEDLLLKEHRVTIEMIKAGIYENTGRK
jgi:hypothetical protein